MTSSFAPCNDLPFAQFVKAFWQTEGRPQYIAETILPKGVVELIFSFKGTVAFQQKAALDFRDVPRCFVSGLTDCPLQLRTPQHQVFFGIELHPAALKKMVNVPCGEFLNAVTDLEAISKECSVLWHRLAAAASFNERVAIAKHWILQKRCALPDQEMAVSAFLTAPMQPVSVKSLASRFCYSSRQLHRKARELFGMSTEELIQYKRYVHALQLMHHSNQSLTRIGYDCHYFDQAHFIRAFKDYTGLTPGQYRQQRSRLVGHLYQ
ncbi:MAG TPA: AraC family transcriptional regulator [Flavisolibacter sp.]